MAFDPITQQVVLFGGADCTGNPCVYFGDTWAWDGAAWTLMDTPVAPSPRSSASIVWDPELQQVILFGGTNLSTQFNDTWAWDGSQWTQLLPATSPSSRSGAGLAWDSRRDEAVLFGGYNGGNLDDTWIWRGSSWAEVSTTAAPDARFKMGLAFDQKHGYALLYGGEYIDLEGEYFLDDTWVWDGAAWHQRHPATIPPASTGTAMVYDSTDRYPVLYLGATWLWDGSNWRRASSPTKPNASSEIHMAFDDVRGEAVMLAAGFARCDGFGETWTWAWHSWTLHTPEPPCPDGREDAAMSYDLSRRETLLFGGNSLCNGCLGYLNDTWVWDGSTWTQRHPKYSPTVRYSGGMAYDSAAFQTVLFGGLGCNAQGGCTYYLGDTWIWDGSAWHRTQLATHPSARYSFGMAYDAARERIVLFGGFTDPGTSNETWTWDGTAWTKQNPAQSPSPMGGLLLAYDRARQQAVLFGTDSSTWTWDGTTWTKQSPAHHPSLAEYSSMTYDDAMQRVVFFGNDRTTWAWDGTDWTQLNPPMSPSSRLGESMSYDVARQRVVLFGGNYSPPKSDTWVFDGTTWTQVSP